MSTKYSMHPPTIAADKTQSLVLKSATGELVHLASVTKLSTCQFNTEAGIAEALANEQFDDADLVLYAMVKSDSKEPDYILAFKCADDYNVSMMGLDPTQYVYSVDLHLTTQTRIIHAWGVARSNPNLTSVTFNRNTQ